MSKKNRLGSFEDFGPKAVIGGGKSSMFPKKQDPITQVNQIDIESQKETRPQGQIESNKGNNKQIRNTVSHDEQLIHKSYNIKKSTYQRLKKFAFDNNYSASSAVDTAINDFIDKMEEGHHLNK